MTDERTAAYALCAQISGRCSCAERMDMPCDAIAEMVDDGVTAAQEAFRIAREIRIAGLDRDA